MRLKQALYSCGTGQGVTNLLTGILYATEDNILHHLSAVHKKCLEVGRLELWRGRLPCALVEWQHTILAKDESTRPLGREGSIWATKVVTAILQEFLLLWWQRNEIRHGRADGHETKRRRERAEARCKSLTPRIKRLRPSDQKLFEDENTVLKWKTGAIFSYLYSKEPLLQKCEEEVGDRPKGDWDMTEGEVIDPP